MRLNLIDVWYKIGNMPILVKSQFDIMPKKTYCLEKQEGKEL
jgi:hypothetical protein